MGADGPFSNFGKKAEKNGNQRDSTLKHVFAPRSGLMVFERTVPLFLGLYGVKIRQFKLDTILDHAFEPTLKLRRD